MNQNQSRTKQGPIIVVQFYEIVKEYEKSHLYTCNDLVLDSPATPKF